MNRSHPEVKLEVRPVRLSESLSARIEGLIRAGELGPGDWLAAERTLASQLGVSRSSVREATQELMLKGLLVRRHGRGTRVADRPRTDVLIGRMSTAERAVVEVLDFRRAVEPAIAEVAAERAVPADLEELNQVLESMRATKSPAKVAELDATFHRRIATATHNDLFVQLIDAASAWVATSRRSSLQSARRRRESLSGHARILQALQRGDAAEAATETRAHIDAIARIITVGRERSGG